ncbi:MAG TPA: PBP1A family penicillin-binding protein [Thermoanaerobaculia bacterium]|nr:PBP1A family penicillin-binding protein [Thermoanaerobaculia bacterium]
MGKRGRVRHFLWRHAFGIAFVVMLVFVIVIGYAGYNYVLINRKFDSSRRWDLPSRIYSDAMPLVPGLNYPRDLLEPKLNHVGYHEVDRPLRNPGEYRFLDDALEVYLQNFTYPDMEFHAMPVRVDFNKGRVEKISRLPEGTALRAVRLEPELITSIFDDVMEDRSPVPLASVPQHLIDAILVIEDRSFFSHEGISLRGILRAAITNLRHGEVRAGGSTLTQQLVKNLYLDPSRSYARKVREAAMAVMLEARYSKEEILEAYLNEIYLGQNGAVQINGVEEASRVYFSKHVNYLTLAESATLAGMIRFPNGYSPLNHPERARSRRNVVLQAMREEGKITDEQYRVAAEAPMTVNRFPKRYRSAPYFVDLVMKQLRETYPETQLKTEGLRIFTTLDTIMQRAAEEALERGVESLAKRYAHIRNSDGPLEGVVVTIQPGTGYVKALVGGRNYVQSQFNRALQAKRQPGSLFKPFVYVAAMDPSRSSEALTASSILDDSPISVETGKSAWRPQNYDGQFRGPTPVREAIFRSYNIPAVRAALDAGVPNVIKLASKIGVQSRLEPYPSISLGSFEVTPLEIAYAYSVFANDGVKAEPISILAVVTADGRILESREVTMQRVAPPGLCYVMNDMLKDVLTRGTAARLRSMGFTRRFAGKTGTTNNYRDAWFIGYSPRVLSLVWVGFDDAKNVRLSGSDAAVPIWGSYMIRVAGMVPDIDFKRPDDVVDRQIDSESGMLATPFCPRVVNELYVSGTQPSEFCTLHSPLFDDRRPFLGSRPARRSGEPPLIAEAGERPGLPQTEQGEAAARRKEKRIKRILRWMFEENP